MSTIHFDPDDPRLTAYALGEATEAERQAVEQLLAISPAARAAVEQIKLLAHRLEEDFAREIAAYQATRPQPSVPANIVPFPSSARRLRHSTSTLLWKAAAVLVISAPLMWIAARRYPVTPLASVQSAPTTVATPPTQILTPLTVDQLRPAVDESPRLAAARTSQARSAAVELDARPVPPPSPASPGTDADQAVALQTTSEPGASSAPGEAASDAAAMPPPAQPAASSAVRSAQALATAEAPLLAARAVAPAPASQAPLAAPSANNQVAAAIAKLRQADGTYIAGVLLKPGGLILAATRPVVADKNTQAIAVLADGRELAVTLDPTGDFAALFRVDESSLPTVTLAANLSVDDSPLLIARVDKRTGVSTFAEMRPKIANRRVYLDGDAATADFVFNQAGQLLATERTDPSLAKATASMRQSVRRNVSAALAVRPYTAAERAILTRPPQ